MADGGRGPVDAAELEPGALELAQCVMAELFVERGLRRGAFGGAGFEDPNR